MKKKGVKGEGGGGGGGEQRDCKGRFRHGEHFPLVSCFPPSRREELHLQTLKAFVELHEFSDLNLVQALRSVLFTSASTVPVILSTCS